MSVPDMKKFIWILDLLVANKVGVEKSIFHRALLLLMEKGVFVNLLMRIEIFSDIKQQACWNQLFFTLNNYMHADLRNTNIYERSIYYKSKIFEKTSVIVNGVEKLGDCRQVLPLTFLIYGNFLKIAEVDYCRSMIRSHVQEGTLRKMAQLLSEHSQNEEILKMCSLFHTEIFLYMTIADKNTFYNKPCNKITAELRSIAPILIKILGWKQEWFRKIDQLP